MTEDLPAAQSSRGRVRILVALSLLAVGCGPTQPGHAATTRRDSSGVEIVVSDHASWSSEQAWRLASKPTITIGKAGGEPEYLLTGVAGALRLPTGVIVVAENGTRQLRFYGQHGEFRRAVGGKGGGPGEFQYIDGLLPCRSDSLFAFGLYWKLKVFTTAGDFVRSSRIRMPGAVGIPYTLDCDSQGRFLTAGWGPETMQRRIGLYRTTAHLTLLSRDDSVLHDFGTFPGAERLGTRNGSRPHPFGKSLVHALGHDRLYVGTGDAYSIRVYTLSGALDRIIRRVEPSKTITSEMIKEYRRHVLSQASPDRRAAYRQSLDEMEFPKTLPAYTDFRLDPAGNLWVRAFGVPGGPAPVWSVFDSTGTYLGDVHTPDRFRVEEIGSDYVLGVQRTPLDVEKVVLYRLIKPS